MHVKSLASCNGRLTLSIWITWGGVRLRGAPWLVSPRCCPSRPQGAILTTMLVSRNFSGECCLLKSRDYVPWEGDGRGGEEGDMPSVFCHLCVCAHAHTHTQTHTNKHTRECAAVWWAAVLRVAAEMVVCFVLVCLILEFRMLLMMPRVFQLDGTFENFSYPVTMLWLEVASV